MSTSLLVIVDPVMCQLMAAAALDVNPAAATDYRDLAVFDKIGLAPP